MFSPKCAIPIVSCCTSVGALKQGYIGTYAVELWEKRVKGKRKSMDWYWYSIGDSYILVNLKNNILNAAEIFG